MTDVHDKITRSYNMSRIRSTNTRPEKIVRKFLFSRGFRYRIHYNKLPGNPDIVLMKYRTVIFINGCFWHGHDGCKYYCIPKTRTEWWLNKIQKTKIQDIKNTKELLNNGWKVITIFECELKKEIIMKTLEKIQNTLRDYENTNY